VGAGPTPASANPKIRTWGAADTEADPSMQQIAMIVAAHVDPSFKVLLPSMTFSLPT
jgi:hypothetical protein